MTGCSSILRVLRYFPAQFQILFTNFTCYHNSSEAPNSFTAEDTLELHLHSSHAVISVVLSQLSYLPGLRPAKPGEFTMRAVKSGRMDLTQAEGVHDLVEARTETQRQAAVNLLKVSLPLNFKMALFRE